MLAPQIVPQGWLHSVALTPVGFAKRPTKVWGVTMPSDAQLWRRGHQAAARLLDAFPAPARQGDDAAVNAWAALLAQEQEWFSLVLYEWAQVAGCRPVPASVAAPVAAGLEREAWVGALWELVDAAVAGDNRGLRAGVARACLLGWAEQVNVAFALAARVHAINLACGGRERLEEVVALVADARPPDLPGETELASGSAALLIALVAAAEERGAQQLHLEVLHYHPERFGALSLVLAGVIAALGRIGFVMDRDEDGLPLSLRALRDAPEDPADADSVLAGVARDLVDGIRDRDGAALVAVNARMAGLDEGERLALGWQLALSAGLRVGQLLATKEAPA